MADRRRVRRLLAAEARAGSLTRRRMLLGSVGFASAIYVAHGRATRPLRQDPDTTSLDDWRAFAAGYIAPDGGAMAADVLATSVRRVGGATVLLPAAFGFEHPGRVIINPSYYIFPAIQALAEAVPHPTWDALHADGLRILRLARFGRWHLPVD